MSCKELACRFGFPADGADSTPIPCKELTTLCPAGRASCAEGGHFVTCVPFCCELTGDGPPVGRVESDYASMAPE